MKKPERVCPMCGLIDPVEGWGPRSKLCNVCNVGNNAADLLKCARIAMGLFQTYCMQDQTWMELREELDPGAYRSVRSRYLFLERTIARAEGRRRS